MDDYIIEIKNNHYWEGHWKMKIDLKELVNSAGVKKQRPGFSEKVVSIPLPRAKKLVKLIAEYGDETVYAACDNYLVGNKRLFKYWLEVRKNGTY